MRRFLHYVGVYAIAGVIVTLVLDLTMLVIDPKSVNPVDLSGLPLALTLFYLLFVLPLVVVFDFFGWFYRFGFVKRIIAYNLLAWACISLIFSVLSGNSLSFTEKVLFSIVLLPIYLLPTTLGAIIMNWLIYGIQTFGENLRKPEKIKMILRSIRTLLACLHSLFRKVLFK
jgi:hypothetical protein